MIVNLLVLVVLIVIALLFGWFAVRAWGTHRRFVRWPGIILAGLVTLLFLLITGVYARGFYQLYSPRQVLVENVTIAGTPDQVARGEHLASVLCASCHSLNGTPPLSGGNDLTKDIPLPLGSIIPPNITPGGKLKLFSDSDVFRILRTGVEPGGRLTFMSGVESHNLSDEDTRAIIAFLRSQPASDNPSGTVSFSPLAVVMLGAGAINLSVPANTGPIAAPAKAATAEYGQYVLNFMDCHGCHGPTLTADGGVTAPPGTPNLTYIVPKWTKDDFFQAMRTGVDLTGHSIRPPMPWKNIGKLDDVELEAVYLYLHNLTPTQKPQ